MAEENKPELKKEKKKRTILQKTVNVFLWIGIGLLALILLALGITQTSTFKNYLREKIVEIADSSLNGQLHIGKIEGTIFTSLFLDNTALTYEQDTVVFAERIEIKISPLKLLAKTIFARSIILKNGRINFVYDEDGELNFAKIFPPGEDDTEAGEFPFKIEAADLQLINMNFSMQDYTKTGEYKTYSYFNYDDLHIRNLNLSLSAFADINEDEFEAEIRNISSESNVDNFNLKKLRGKFFVNKNELAVEGLYIETNDSRISLTGSMRQFNIFDTTSAQSIENALINVDLKTDNFSFNNLEKFIPGFNELQGDAGVELHGKGTLKEFLIDYLEVTYRRSHLALEGTVKNLDEPENIFITAEFNNTHIFQQDVNMLLPEADIPVYEEYGVINFQTLTFSGEPTNFKTKAAVSTDKGSFTAEGSLNFNNPQMRYDIVFSASGLDIAPFAGMPAVVNARGDVKGTGTDPANMNAVFNFYGAGTVIDGNRFDTLRLNAAANNKLIDYRLLAKQDTTRASLAGNFNFTDADHPEYTLKGEVKDLNLYRYFQDTTLQSDLDFTIDGEGKSFNLDDLQLYLSLNLHESTINEINVDSTRLIADIFRQEDGGRVINIISDLADFTFTGNYSLEQTVEIIRSEAILISAIVSEKTEMFLTTDSIIAHQTAAARLSDDELFQGVDSATTMTYHVDLKDFKLSSIFLKNNQLEINGELNGELRNTRDSIYINYSASIDYLKYWNPEGDVFFINKLYMELNLINSYETYSLDNVYADLHLTTNRIFSGSDIKDMQLNLKLQNNIAALDFSAGMDDNLYTKLNGGIDLSGNSIVLKLDTMDVRYNNLNFINSQPVDISYSEDRINFNQFVLSDTEGGELKVEGTVVNEGNQNLKITLSNVSGKTISTKLLKLQEHNALEARLNMTADISGSFQEPVMDLSLNIDSVTFKNKNFGNLIGKLDYKSQDLKVDIRFIDSTINKSQPALLISGNIPVDLALGGSPVELSDENISLKLLAENFNLGAFGDILPAVNKLSGNFTADVNIGGTIENPQPNGFISLTNGSFLAEANNLQYLTTLKVTLNNNNITVDTLKIQNAGGTRYGGTMFGQGKAGLENFNLVSADFFMNGELKVLDEVSKSASPAVYGDLVIATRGQVEFKLEEGRAYLEAPITVKRANLTFPPTQSAYQNTNADFVYKFVEAEYADTGDGTGPDFEALVRLSQQRGTTQRITASKETGFDYSIDIQVEEEATIIFVLSKEFNQNLTAVLKGDFKLVNEDGRTRALGELQLLEGSTLQFIKTLTADGSIRFENELANPYLNIVATYRDYYDNPATEVVEDVDVAVKIKIKGYLQELDKNFIQEQDNVAVYYGSEDIENDNIDRTKTTSDAVMFLITGKFAEDLSQGEQQQAGSLVATQATSLAGSVLGGFLNRHLGNYVRNIEVRRVGTETRFSLVGRAGDFKYTLGGSSGVFSDLSNASIKIEYPITRRFFIRVERREEITETNISNEMINELGLKYRFEF